MSKKKKASTNKAIVNKRILAMLRQNSRRRSKEISTETKIPLKEVNAFMRNNNCIKKNTAIVDFERIGYKIKLFLALSVSSMQKESVEEFLTKSLHANTIHKINNGYDFLAELIFKDMDESNNFIENLETRFRVYDKKEYYILETKKEQIFMTNHNFVF